MSNLIPHLPQIKFIRKKKKDLEINLKKNNFINTLTYFKYIFCRKMKLINKYI